jgi:hypothetical protein
VFGKSMPLIYAFLSNKTTFIYLKLFTKLKELFLIKAKYAISDFEKALINASNEIFHVENLVCIFHFDKTFGEEFNQQNKQTNTKTL